MASIKVLRNQSGPGVLEFLGVSVRACDNNLVRVFKFNGAGDIFRHFVDMRNQCKNVSIISFHHVVEIFKFL